MPTLNANLENSWGSTLPATLEQISELNPGISAGSISRTDIAFTIIGAVTAIISILGLFRGCKFWKDYAGAEPRASNPSTVNNNPSMVHELQDLQAL